MEQAQTTLQTVAFLIGIVSPLVVAYVTKRSWDSRIKTVLNTGLSTVSTVIAGLVIEPGMSVGSFFRSAATAFVTAFVSHIAWSKGGVTDKVADKGVKDEHQLAGGEDLSEYVRIDPAELEDGDELDSVVEETDNG